MLVLVALFSGHYWSKLCKTKSICSVFFTFESSADGDSVIDPSCSHSDFDVVYWRGIFDWYVAFCQLCFIGDLFIQVMRRCVCVCRPIIWLSSWQAARAAISVCRLLLLFNRGGNNVQKHFVTDLYFRVYHLRFPTLFVRSGHCLFI